MKTRSAPPGREISEVPRRGRCSSWGSPAAGGHRGGSPPFHAWPCPGRAPTPGHLPAGKEGTRGGSSRSCPAVQAAGGKRCRRRPLARPHVQTAVAVGSGNDRGPAPPRLPGQGGLWQQAAALVMRKLPSENNLRGPVSGDIQFRSHFSFCPPCPAADETLRFT